MKHISFLISFFLLVGCSTPDIHIPSYTFGSDNNDTNSSGPEAATTAVASIEDDEDEEITEEPTVNNIAPETAAETKPKTENNISPVNETEVIPTLASDDNTDTPENKTDETKIDKKSNIPAIDTEEDEKSTTKEQASPKADTAPKIETKGGFFSLFGKKPKVKNEYYTGGKIRSKLVMDDDTGESGLLYKYGYDGNVASTVHIKHGLKNGLETLFDEKGHIMKRTPYVNGRKDGIVEVYYPDGKVLAQITYVNNKRHGRASKYNHDGTTNKEVQYNHGKVIDDGQNDDIEIPIID